MKKVLLLVSLLLIANTLFGQKALKILKVDGSTTYINASAVAKITFVTLAIALCAYISETKKIKQIR